MNSHDVKETIWSRERRGVLQESNGMLWVGNDLVDPELCNLVKPGDRVRIVSDLVDLECGTRQRREYVVRDEAQP